MKAVSDGRRPKTKMKRTSKDMMRTSAEALGRICAFFTDMVDAWLFPQGEICLLCKKPYPGPAWLCESCAAELPYAKRLCPVCGVHETCHFNERCGTMHVTWNIDKTAVAFFYKDTARLLIHRLKFSGMRDFARPLGVYMARAIPKDWPCDAVLVPVPLAEDRLRIRGFNQTELLAQEISALRGYAIVPALARRTQKTAQSSLSADARAKNVQTAFSLAEGISLAGKSVILVDDVLTTGATAVACAKLLRRAGAEYVCFLSAAYTMPHFRSLFGEPYVFPSLIKMRTPLRMRLRRRKHP